MTSADLPIADYAIVGDMRSTALVSRNGRVDWLCLPRHDGPAVFLRLLDPGGGCCELFLGAQVPSSRRYLPDTNVLETTFRSGEAEIVLTDAMPVSGTGPVETGPDSRAPGLLLRHLRCTRGRAAGRFVMRPTFDHARRRLDAIDVEGGRATFRAGADTLAVQASHPLEANAEEVAMAFDLRADETAFVAMGVDVSSDLDPARLLEETCAYWREWAARCAYDGPFRQAVLRSALCLKLLTYAPTGAIVAAATYGLPEAAGGSRNWDYRFTWIRDASFCVGAFLNLGYRHEANEFVRFLREADPTRGRDLRVIYPIAGELMPEQVLDGLRGWSGARPVRIGNDAAGQKQHDIYGDYLSALRLYIETLGDEVPASIREGLPELVTNLARAAEQRWQEPDAGIWELRTAPGHLFHSKGMCWLALDSAIRLAPALHLDEEEVSRWAVLRERIWDEYHERCWDEERQAYVAGYEQRTLDAAVMRCTLFGANDPADPKLERTLRAIERDLADGGPHVRRYRMPDGFDEEEGAFFACSFWLAGNWALGGHTIRARDRYAELIACGNDLGLFSEEIDPRSGDFLGNYPQAFTHMALINGVVRLERCIERFGLA